MNKIKVLLVEDETSLAMILSDTLEAQGFEYSQNSSLMPLVRSQWISCSLK